MLPFGLLICVLLLNEIVFTNGQAMSGENCKTEDGLVKDLLIKMREFERFRLDTTNQLKKPESELQDTKARLVEVEFGKRFLINTSIYTFICKQIRNEQGVFKVKSREKTLQVGKTKRDSQI